MDNVIKTYQQDVWEGISQISNKLTDIKTSMTYPKEIGHEGVPSCC